ncbi:MAG: helix-turn-helix transcriptional regulator [Candidatus Woesearchaeota archaeon]
MINKKIGVFLIIFAIFISVVLIIITGALRTESEILGCFERPECEYIDTSLSLSHFAFGVVGFILALGVYLVFFYSGEKEILRRLEEQKNMQIDKERFDILLSALDTFESDILKLVKEQDGIPQKTLVLRSNLSKSKVSEVLKSLEAKNLVKKVKKRKNNYVYLKKPF